jgi:hypothetical protein
MGKYVLVYRGGGGMPESAEEQEAVMAEWIGWFGELGDAVVDAGNPFGASMTVATDASVSDGNKAGLGGYSILNADSLAKAADLAKGCPVLAAGGSVEAYEALDVM